MLRITNPFPIYLDLHGDLLDAGYIYAGVAESDPEVAPIQLYWDAALTVPAVQPLRTRGGVIVNNGSPALVYTSQSDFSMRIRDSAQNLVAYAPSAKEASDSIFQEANANLTAIAEEGPTTAYGRSLIRAADEAAAKVILGIGIYLPLTGGTVTGDIKRYGGGAHLYHVDPAFISGRIFASTTAAPDPTSINGDIWLKYST
jgi:hypothetical protein